MTWSGDSIVFAQSGVGIRRVSANGGEPETLVPVPPPQLVHGPRLLKGGRALLYTLATDNVSANLTERWDRAEIVLHSLDSGERTTVVRGGSDARYVNTGHLVYAVGGTLMAVRFDLDTGQTAGAAAPIITDIARGASALTGAAQFDVSDRGTLVYVPSDPSDSQQVLALATLDGTIRALPMPPGTYERPRIAPDGSRAALTGLRGESQIWVYDLKSSVPPRRLTFSGQNVAPVWSPDSRMIAFQSSREGDLGLFRQRADGSGSAERMTKAAPGFAHFPEDWSRDGATLVYREFSPAGNSLWMLPLTGDRRPQQFSPVPAGRSRVGGVLSPDGKWLAYGTNELGGTAFYVFVEPVPPTGAKHQVSTEIGSTPVWSPDGRRIYTAFAERVVAVDVTTEPEFVPGRMNPVPTGSGIASSPTVRNFDVMPDGKQLLLLTPPISANAKPVVPQMIVVVNWFEDLRARLP